MARKVFVMVYDSSKTNAEDEEYIMSLLEAEEGEVWDYEIRNFAISGKGIDAYQTLCEDLKNAE